MGSTSNDLKSKYKGVQLSLTIPHNDFSLRNILNTKNRNFKIIDWDAMIHESFPDKAPAWHDVTCLFINIQSLIRFYPLINKKNINRMSWSFIYGYSKNNHSYNNDDLNKFLWCFSFAYYLGLIGDRPLPKIYKSKISRRYIKILHNYLIKGEVSII